MPSITPDFMKRNSSIALFTGIVGISCTICSSLLADSQDAFSERRAKVLAEFDHNGDGRLDATEREAARVGRKDAKDGDKGRRKREEEPHPPELLAKYDKDKSGSFSTEE